MRHHLKAAAATILAIGSISCDRPSSSTTPPTGAPRAQGSEMIGSKAPAITAGTPTGYAEVIPYLNANGSQLAFYDTRKIVGSVKTALDAFAGIMKTADKDSEAAAIVLPLLLDFSGVESVAAIGSSSVPRTAETAYNRAYLRFNPGSSKSGAIWNLFGTQSRKLDLLDVLPDTTGGAFFSVVDLAWVDQALEKIAIQAGKPAEFAQFKEGIQQTTGLAWKDLLQGIGDEVLIFITLSPTETLSIPLGKTALSMPSPSIALVLKPKGEALFQLLTKQLEKEGLKMEQADGTSFFAQPIPHPVMKGLSPTVAKSGDYLIVGSTKEIALGVPAVAAGNAKSLGSTEEFKALSNEVEKTGNSFTFVSASLTKTFVTLMDAAVDQIPAPQAAQIQALVPFYASFMIPQPTYSVMSRVGDDWLVTGNGPEGNPLQATTQPAVIGMLAAIAVPNFLRARGRGQATTVLNDARMLDGAVDQYSIEQNIQSGATVTFENIRPYLKPTSRLASSGGLDILGNPYIIEPVGQGVKVNPKTIQTFDQKIVPQSFWSSYQ